MLRYPDGTTHPVRIPFAGWASAQVVSQIATILLSEVMGYVVLLLDNAAQNSGQPVRFAAGCEDPDDVECVARNILRPKVHFTLESWQFGISVVSKMRSDIQPTLLGELNYRTYEALYIWDAVARSAAVDLISLDYYNSFDARYFYPRKYFDDWRRLLQIPKDFVLRCSDMRQGFVNGRDIVRYSKVQIIVPR